MNLFSTDKSKSKTARSWQLISRFTWELPQTTLGLLLALIYAHAGNDTTHAMHKGINYIHSNAFPSNAGISLGSFIITGTSPTESLIVHEFGHTIQSRRLGPFYLLLIGLPSLFWAAMHKNIPAIKSRYPYFGFFVEKQADKLGKKHFGR